MNHMNGCARAWSVDRHEDVDDVVAAVVLQRRSCLIGVGTLSEPLRGRPNLFVNRWRLSIETNARVSTSGQSSLLGAEGRRVVTRAKDGADAVGLSDRVKRAVELPPAQTHSRLERRPDLLDLWQLIGDADEHDLHGIAHDDVFSTHGP